MLDEIKRALAAIDGQTVAFGDARSLSGSNLRNYTVFARDRTSISKDRHGSTDYFTFAVVRENFIPEGLIDRTLQALWAIGLKGPSSEVEYDYGVIGKTGCVLEIAVFTMFRPEKRGAV